MSQTPRAIQDFHMDSRGWSDVGYNFLVAADGTAYEGRGWTVQGAHAPGHNTSGIGICVIGSYSRARPSAAALRTVRALYEEANRRAGRRLAVRGHRDVYSTDCPGDAFYSWVRAGMPLDGLPDTGGQEYRREDRDGLLEPYEYGEAIAELQRALRDRGYTIGADGFYGPQTERIVREYQADHGLDVDGIAGPQTLGHIGLTGAPDDPPETGPDAPAFPLASGHWFGPESPDRRNHSGYWPADRPHVRRIRGRLRERGWRVARGDRYDAGLARTIRAVQAEAVREGHETGGVDGLVGAKTWPLLWTKPIT
ncbi:N-acetylmuramoyl-L-alanine amidase [Nocardiopsis sp. CNT-189]|uniref:peptidoglycan recognition protein family protein n=1 Tax=Nocardiopsis oceanisediminis TaxID=2816862 RepID=UPI003B3B7A9A